MALAEALSQCSVKSGLEVIHTPRSFSDETTLSLVQEPPAFILYS